MRATEMRRWAVRSLDLRGFIPRIMDVREWTHVYHASDVDALVLSFDRDRAETLASLEEAVDLLRESRIALTAYSRWLLEESNARGDKRPHDRTYPFGQNAEKNSAAFLSRIDAGKAGAR